MSSTAEVFAWTLLEERQPDQATQAQPWSGQSGGNDNG